MTSIRVIRVGGDKQTRLASLRRTWCLLYIDMDGRPSAADPGRSDSQGGMTGFARRRDVTERVRHIDSRVYVFDSGSGARGRLAGRGFATAIIMALGLCVFISVPSSRCMMLSRVHIMSSGARART